MYCDFGCSGGGLAILLLNCPSNRAPIVHAEVYCNIVFFHYIIIKSCNSKFPLSTPIASPSMIP